MISEILLTVNTNYKEDAKLHLKENFIVHQHHTNAIMSAIKPGCCSVLFKKFTKQMISDYLHKLKYENEEEQQQVNSN